MKYLFVIISISLILYNCGDDKSSSKEPDNNQQEAIDSAELVSVPIIVDNIDSLLFALDNAKENDTIIVVDRIELQKTLEIRDKRNLIISGDYGVICFPADDAVINLINCENITIQGLNLFHDIESDCSKPVLGLFECSDIYIKDNDIHGSGAIGISTGGGCVNIDIRNNKIHDCSYTGLEISSNYTSITENIFYNNGYGGDNMIFLNDVKETCEINANTYKLVDHSRYISDIDGGIEHGIYTEKQNDSPEGIESISGLYEDGELVYIEYIYSEEDEEFTQVYLRNKKPVYIYSKYSSYADPDLQQDNNQIEEDHYYFLKNKMVLWTSGPSTDQVKVEDSNEIAKKQEALKSDLIFYTEFLDQSPYEELQ